MSTVKTNNAQIGQSVTATNNFTMYQPSSPDGTVRWGVGNSGSVTDIVTLNSSGYVGIGTSSPAEKLTVSGSASVSSDLILKESTTARGYIFGTSAGLTYRAASVPHVWQNGGTEQMRLDSSGNLGLGVTPSAWGSFKALQIGGGTYNGIASTNAYLLTAANAYFDGAAFKYTSSGAASSYTQNGGAHYWNVAPSGTAGNAISFTQAMTLDASGNLGIGTSSPTSYASKTLQVTGSGVDVALKLTNSTTGSGNSVAYDLELNGNDINYVNRTTTGVQKFWTNATERMRIDSSGNVGIGTSSPNSKLAIGGSSDISFVSDGQGISWGNANNGSPRIYGSAAVSTGYLAFKGAGGSEAVRIDYSNNLQFNSGYGSVATAYGCRAWVNFNGTGTVAIRGSGNVSSITDNGTGQYTVNFSSAMPDANYSKNVSLSGEPGVSDAKAITTDILQSTRVAPTTSAFAFTTWNWSANPGDSTYVYAAVFR